MIKRRLIVGLLAAGFATACAQLPRGEYRAGLFLHEAPKYSFRIPSGWRPATAPDYLSFGHNRRVLGKLDDAGRRQFAAAGAMEMRAYDAVLISSGGAWLSVDRGVNQGVRFSPGYELNEQEKQTAWQLVSRELVRVAPPTDKPRLTLKTMAVVDRGRNTVLRVHFQSDVQRGALIYTVFGLYSTSHVVTITHLGTPEDPEEGLSIIEGQLIPSFQFE